MLAMFSMALLLADRSLRADIRTSSIPYSETCSLGPIDSNCSRELKLEASPSHSNIHSVPPTDYFSLRPRRRTLSSVQAHTGRIPPPIAISTPPVPSLYPETETASPSSQQSPTTASGPK